MIRGLILVTKAQDELNIETHLYEANPSCTIILLQNKNYVFMLWIKSLAILLKKKFYLFPNFNTWLTPIGY